MDKITFDFPWTKHERSGFWWKVKSFEDGILFASMTDAAEPTDDASLFGSTIVDFDLAFVSVQEAVNELKIAKNPKDSYRIISPASLELEGGELFDFIQKSPVTYTIDKPDDCVMMHISCFSGKTIEEISDEIKSVFAEKAKNEREAETITLK